MRLYREVFDGYSKSNFNFIKFHMLLHYPQFLREFGSIIPTNGYWWEAAIKFFLKIPYKGVNKSRQGLTERLQRAMITRHIIYRNIAMYADPVVQQHLIFNPADYVTPFLASLFAQHQDHVTDLDGHPLYDPVAVNLRVTRHRHRSSTEMGVLQEIPSRPDMVFHAKGSRLVLSQDGSSWKNLPPHMGGMEVDEVMPSWVRQPVRREELYFLVPPPFSNEEMLLIVRILPFFYLFSRSFCCPRSRSGGGG